MVIILSVIFSLYDLDRMAYIGLHFFTGYDLEFTVVSALAFDEWPAVPPTASDHRADGACSDAMP
jgi:hypothetical protein